MDLSSTISQMKRLPLRKSKVLRILVTLLTFGAKNQTDLSKRIQNKELESGILTQGSSICLLTRFLEMDTNIFTQRLSLPSLNRSLALSVLKNGTLLTVIPSTLRTTEREQTFRMTLPCLNSHGSWILKARSKLT